MSQPLSPAAQAVRNAIKALWNSSDRLRTIEEVAAAAICAAADQVVPHLEEPDWGVCNEMRCDIELYTDHMRKRSEILAIVAELEGRDG